MKRSELTGYISDDHKVGEFVRIFNHETEGAGGIAAAIESLLEGNTETLIWGDHPNKGDEVRAVVTLAVMGDRFRECAGDGPDGVGSSTLGTTDKVLAFAAHLGSYATYGECFRQLEDN